MHKECMTSVGVGKRREKNLLDIIVYLVSYVTVIEATSIYDKKHTESVQW